MAQRDAVQTVASRVVLPSGVGGGTAGGRRAGWGSMIATGGGSVPRNPADEALLAMARLAMDASVRAADDMGGVSPVQLRALTALRKAGPLNLAQLAEEMGVTVSTASRLVDRLVAVDWVHRRQSPHNRREISLTLTPQGNSLLRRFDDQRVQRLQACLTRLAPERRDVVVAALQEFADAALDDDARARRERLSRPRP